MAGYNEIRGLRVKYLSADPANPENGQVWYNSTTANLRVEGIALAAAWASGGNLNTARGQLKGCGTKTAMLVAGGASSTASEQYDGSSWTTTPNVSGPPIEAASVVGTTSAALAAAGYNNNPPVGPTNGTQYWNGSSWSTQGGTLIVPGYAKGQAGIQTAAIVWGGAYPGSGTTPATESWNGSSWTAGNVLGSSMYYSGSAGIQTAALAFGGNFPALPATDPGRKVVQSWDGTSWTDSPTSINNYRQGTMSGGIQTAAFLTGGDNPAGGYYSQTEVYDGSSWSISPASLTTARTIGAGAGASNTSGIVAGGYTPAVTGATEEFTGFSIITKNLSVS
jgi:hypothetical protein